MSKNIDDEIAKLKSQIDKLEKERLEKNNLTPTQRIAEYLHDNLCHWNHTDQCGWGYDSWKEPGDTRKQYLQKAQNIYKAIEDHVSDVLYHHGIDDLEIEERNNCPNSQKEIEDLIGQIIRSIK